MHGSHGPFVFGAVVGLLVAMHLSPVPATGPRYDVATEAASAEAEQAVRIGVYDSRGVAVAWFRSEHNDIASRMKGFREAEAAGDEAEAAEFEKWAVMHQRKLHFQGFGTYPVEPYIADIRELLPELLDRRGLDAIVWMQHAHTERVEIVDVTVDLMVLLGMDRAAAEKMAREMGKNKPLDFATLFEMDPRD